MDEGDATTNYTVSLSPSGVTPTSDLTVSYGTADGTATAGSDYTAKSGTLTFTSTAAGSQTFTVQTTGRHCRRGHRRDVHGVDLVSFGWGWTRHRALRHARRLRTTITDDDDAPTGITSALARRVWVRTTRPHPITVTATLNGGTLPSDTVVTIGTFAGSATKDTDYTATDVVVDHYSGLTLRRVRVR